MTNGCRQITTYVVIGNGCTHLSLTTSLVFWIWKFPWTSYFVLHYDCENRGILKTLLVERGPIRGQCSVLLLDGMIALQNDFIVRLYDCVKHDMLCLASSIFYFVGNGGFLLIFTKGGRMHGRTDGLTAWPTDRRTDRLTNGHMVRPSYRNARMYQA